MKTELSRESQLDLAGLEGSSFIIFLMSFSDIDSRRAFYCYFLILFDFRSSKGAHWAPKWLPNGIKKAGIRVTFTRSGPEGVPGCHLGWIWELFGMILESFWCKFLQICGACVTILYHSS